MHDIPMIKNDLHDIQYFQAEDAPGVILGYQNTSLQERLSITTVEDFFYEHFNAMAESSLKDGIAYGMLNVGKTTPRVRKPTGAFVEAIMLLRLDCVAISEEAFRVDAIMKAKIMISSMENGQYLDDSVEQWFRIPFECTLGQAARSISQLPITIYAAEDRAAGVRLDQYLIQIIKNDDLDHIATQILEKYYPEALATPMPVSGFELAARMGYGIEHALLTPEHSILGRFFFDDEYTQVYDANGSRSTVKAMKKNTILIDSKATALRGTSREEDTIVHECVHGYLDRLPYLLQKAYHEDMQCLPCPASLSLTDADDKFVRVIESRTAKLTARIRMPAEPTKKKIEELYRRYAATVRNGDAVDRSSEITAFIAAELARFYRVSKKTAELRLMELGFDAQKLSPNSTNGFHVPWQPSKCHTEKKWQQIYAISFAEAAEEYQRNPRFTKLVETGRYLYVENYFCIRDEAYITFGSDGSVHMTEYARCHLSECCLLFEMWRQPSQLHESSGLFLRQDLSSLGVAALASENALLEVTQNAAQRAAFVQEARRICQIQSQLPALFTDTLALHIGRLGLNNEKLTERSGISTRTLNDWRNIEKKTKPLKRVVALCIGLQLEPELSADLLRKSRNCFALTEEDALYSLMLRTMYKCSLQDCDVLLQEAGLKPFQRDP